MIPPHIPDRHRRLSTQIVLALAIAMLPMGVLAVVLAIRGYGAIGTAAPTLAQILGLVLPVAMWLVALLTAWFAVHRLIVRPLDAIQRVIAEYDAAADPVRSGQQRLKHASHDSAEIAALAASFESMADAVDMQSRALRAALAEQQRLTGEVHHRVKNNLQIVASLLSLQARAADSPDVTQAYAMIQARIQALAEVHRWMYDDAAGAGVNLRSLATALCAGLEASLLTAKHPVVIVSHRLDTIFIHPDAAVPVALLITELASLAADAGAPGPLSIKVTATEIAGATAIAVGATGFVGADPLAAASSTPMARIVAGMARQLRSQLVHTPAEGTYSVSFFASPP